MISHISHLLMKFQIHARGSAGLYFGGPAGQTNTEHGSIQ